MPLQRGKLMSWARGILQAPSGYDSVIGEPGKSLNYDEAIGELCASCCSSLLLIRQCI